MPHGKYGTPQWLTSVRLLRYEISWEECKLSKKEQKSITDESAEIILLFSQPQRIKVWIETFWSWETTNTFQICSGFVAAHTLPILYEKYEDEVDTFAYKVFDQLCGHYQKFDSSVLSKIPRGAFKGKKYE